MSQISVELIDHMGSDKRVAEIARVSFARDEFISKDLEPKDLRLLNFLARGTTSEDFDWLLQDLQGGVGMREDAVKLYERIKYQSTHWTPFAHNAFTIKCAAPVPIRTQLYKHGIGLVANEESRRYISNTPEIYIPDFFRAKPEGSIKQGSGDEHHQSKEWMRSYTEHCKNLLDTYEQMIADGICPEQARFILPQGMMVNWVWTGNLVAMTNIYNKRIDLHAQKEVQEFAQKLKEAIEPIMPISWAALTRQH